MSATSTVGSSPSPLVPIRIEIGGPGSKPYKSIDHVVWDDVPPFAVLTGLNGSGKTQLLEILAYRLTNTLHPQLGDLSQVKVTISGDSLSTDSVAFVPSRWDIGATPVLGIAQMQQAKQQLYENLREHNVRHDMARRQMRARLERLLDVSNLDQVAQETFIKRLPDDFAFMLDEADVTLGLTHVFLAYRLRAAEALESGTARSDIQTRFGPAPWDVVNETFQAAEFPYRVVSPIGTKLLEPYELFLEDPSTKQRIRPIDLSSGEKVLLGLVLWLYNSQHHGRFPRLFLLDEPDAHLHPSMTRHLLSVIKDVLVERYQVRTVLTTHSPSTVALAPADAVFEMSRIQPRIRQSTSQAATIGLLTAGLVTVSPSTRYVLVEDEEDVTFYSTIRDLLVDYGPGRDPRAIKPAPTLVFLPASTGSGKGKVASGKTVVQGWVDKFDQPPLNELVRGVIDKDVGNGGSTRVAVIGRYSIENYYLDPFVVFGVLVEDGIAPVVPSLAITIGEEHRLRIMDSSVLQGIINVIGAAVEPTLKTHGSLDTSPRIVTFTNGRTVEYPVWMLEHRGHDLLSVYQTVFGGRRINLSRLERSLRRIRLIPKELADILDTLQS